MFKLPALLPLTEKGQRKRRRCSRALRHPKVGLRTALAQPSHGEKVGELQFDVSAMRRKRVGFFRVLVKGARDEREGLVCARVARHGGPQRLVEGVMIQDDKQSMAILQVSEI